MSTTIDRMPVNWATKDDTKEQWQARRDALTDRMIAGGKRAALVEKLRRFVDRALRTFPKSAEEEEACPPAYGAEKASGAAAAAASNAADLVQEERKRLALRSMRVDEYNIAWKIYLESIGF